MAWVSLCIWALCVQTLQFQAADQENQQDFLKIWYSYPVLEWMDALPNGNGWMDAMVYGGTQLEQLQINDDTLWSGEPHDYSIPKAYSHLTTVRQLLEDGDYEKAEAESEKMMGMPVKKMAYQPLGDLFLNFPQGEKSSDNRRELDLQNAVSTVSYRVGGVQFTRKVFASHPDQAIVMHLDCDRPERITFNLFKTSHHPNPKRLRTTRY